MLHLQSSLHQSLEDVQGERTSLANAIVFGGQKHRKLTIDSYMIAYFSIKEKLPQTIGSRLKLLLPHLSFCDAKAVASVPMSRPTCARYVHSTSPNSFLHLVFADFILPHLDARRALKIGDHLQQDAKEKCRNCFYASIMFDEASNIHMSGLLNVFVNLLTNDYQVINIIGFKMHKLIYTLYTHYLLLVFWRWKRSR